MFFSVPKSLTVPLHARQANALFHSPIRILLEVQIFSRQYVPGFAKLSTTFATVVEIRLPIYELKILWTVIPIVVLAIQIQTLEIRMRPFLQRPPHKTLSGFEEHFDPAPLVVFGRGVRISFATLFHGIVTLPENLGTRILVLAPLVAGLTGATTLPPLDLR